MRYYEKRQYQKLTVLSSWLKRNQDEVTGKVPALEDHINELHKQVKDVLQLQKGNKAVFVSAIEKKGIRKAFSDIIYRLSGLLRAYQFDHKASPGRGKKTAKSSQPKITYYTMSDLDRASADNLCKIGLQVINGLKKIKYGHRYGFTPEDIKDAEAYYKEFAAIKKAPQKRKKETAAKNNETSAVIKHCMALLENSIDPLMMTATKENPNLWSHYKSLRVVLPKSGGRMSDEEAAYRRMRARKPKKDTPEK